MLAQALDRDGYIVVPDVLGAACGARLLRAFEQAQASGTQHVAIDGSETLGNLPVVQAAAEQLLGRPFRVRDVHGRKPLPGFGQQGLHSDWLPRSSADECFVVTAIFMLDDFTRDNGATRVVPGSHRIVRAIPKSLAQPLAVHPDEIVITGSAGSVLVFNGHLWHSGRRNDSAGPRRAVQMVVVGG